VAAVGLALASAALFGAMSVALRLALRSHPDAEVGALTTAIAALVPCGAFAAANGQVRILRGVARPEDSRKDCPCDYHVR